jgi:hypothetical protein
MSIAVLEAIANQNSVGYSNEVALSLYVSFTALTNRAEMQQMLEGRNFDGLKILLNEEFDKTKEGNHELRTDLKTLLTGGLFLQSDMEFKKELYFALGENCSRISKYNGGNSYDLPFSQDNLGALERIGVGALFVGAFFATGPLAIALAIAGTGAGVLNVFGGFSNLFTGRKQENQRKKIEEAFKNDPINLKIEEIIRKFA